MSRPEGGGRIGVPLDTTGEEAILRPFPPSSRIPETTADKQGVLRFGRIPGVERQAESYHPFGIKPHKAVGNIIVLRPACMTQHQPVARSAALTFGINAARCCHNENVLMAKLCEHLQYLTAADFPLLKTPEACAECLAEGTLGGVAGMPGMRPCRLLRLVSWTSCDMTLQQHRASCDAVDHVRREMDLVLCP